MGITTGIITALQMLQAEMPIIRKDSSGYGYKYASLDNIVSTIVPIMAKHGLCYCQPVGGDGTNISVTTIIMHSDGGMIEGTISAPLASGKAAKMSEIQGAGSVITYLRRYSLSSMLGLVTDEDTDGAPMVKQESSLDVLVKFIKSKGDKSVPFGHYISAQFGVAKVNQISESDIASLDLDAEYKTFLQSEAK